MSILIYLFYYYCSFVIKIIIKKKIIIYYYVKFYNLKILLMLSIQNLFVLKMYKSS